MLLPTFTRSRFSYRVTRLPVDGSAATGFVIRSTVRFPNCCLHHHGCRLPHYPFTDYYSLPPHLLRSHPAELCHALVAACRRYAVEPRHCGITLGRIARLLTHTYSSLARSPYRAAPGLPTPITCLTFPLPHFPVASDLPPYLVYYRTYAVLLPRCYYHTPADVVARFTLLVLRYYILRPFTLFSIYYLRSGRSTFLWLADVLPCHWVTFGRRLATLHSCSLPAPSVTHSPPYRLPPHHTCGLASSPTYGCWFTRFPVCLPGLYLPATATRFCPVWRQLRTRAYRLTLRPGARCLTLRMDPV